MVVVSSKHSLLGIALLAAMLIAAAFLFTQAEDEDAKCPYCDIKALNEHGGTIEFDDGSGTKTLVIESGQYRASYSSSGDCLTIYHWERSLQQSSYGWKYYTTVWGSNIIKVTVNPLFCDMCVCKTSRSSLPGIPCGIPIASHINLSAAG